MTFRLACLMADCLNLSNQKITIFITYIVFCIVYARAKMTDINIYQEVVPYSRRQTFNVKIKLDHDSFGYNKFYTVVSSIDS